MKAETDRAVGHVLLKWASSHGWSTSKRELQASPPLSKRRASFFSLSYSSGIVGQFVRILAFARSTRHVHGGDRMPTDCAKAVARQQRRSIGACVDQMRSLLLPLPEPPEKLANRIRGALQKSGEAVGFPRGLTAGVPVLCLMLGFGVHAGIDGSAL